MFVQHVLIHLHAIMLTCSAVKAYVRKGHALLGMKNTIKASQAFEKALELDPNSVVSHTCTHARTHIHTHTHVGAV